MPFDLDESEYRATRILTGADKVDEINVGEYVRTKKQGIKRIETIFKNKTVNKYGYEIGSEWDGKLYSTIKTTDIIKHSSNIIDLIEVGDYVNGMLVVDKLQTPCRIGKEGKKFVFTKNMNIGEGYFEEDIKSIVTKEQFKSVEYKVGG